MDATAINWATEPIDSIRCLDVLERYATLNAMHLLLIATVWLLASPVAMSAHALLVTGSWKVQSGPCTLVLDEEDHAGYRLRFVQAKSGAKNSCALTAQVFSESFARLLRESSPFQKRGEETVRFFLGRLIELPEVSQELIATTRKAREWNLAEGKPVRGDENVFVARQLLKSEALRKLLGGWKIVRVNVEKVLVPSRTMLELRTRGAVYPNKRVPYDCLLWVELAEVR